MTSQNLSLPVQRFQMLVCLTDFCRAMVSYPVHVVKHIQCDSIECIYCILFIILRVLSTQHLIAR